MQVSGSYSPPCAGSTNCWPSLRGLRPCLMANGIKAMRVARRTGGGRARRCRLSRRHQQQRAGFNSETALNTLRLECIECIEYVRPSDQTGTHRRQCRLTTKCASRRMTGRLPIASAREPCPESSQTCSLRAAGCMQAQSQSTPCVRAGNVGSGRPQRPAPPKFRQSSWQGS